MRWRLPVALFLLFVAAVIARLPATAIASRLPAPFSCADVRGTVWRGQCGLLAIRGQSLGDIRWQLRPWPLLTGQLASHLQLRGAGLNVEADVLRARSGSVTLSALSSQADLALLAPLLRSAGVRIPEGFGGGLRSQIAELQLSAAGAIRSVKGTIDVDGLRQQAAPGALGSWTVSFDGTQSPAGEPMGRVADRGGPFDFQGTIRLTTAPGYVIDGALAPRPGLPPEVVNALRFLGGSADANGRRPFALEGNF